MAEPRIQYAKTADGVSIAFWTLGEGMPLVLMVDPAGSHVEKEWKVALLRGYYERLAEKSMVIRYDGRGLGMSEREVTDISLDTMVADLAAVVDHLRLEKSALFGTRFVGAAAVAYEAASPERVSHLILQDAVVRGADFRESGTGRAYRALRDADWSTYVENFGRLLPGVAELIREAITPETQKMVMDAACSFRAASAVLRLLEKADRLGRAKKS